jgi:hypothetical protein
MLAELRRKGSRRSRSALSHAGQVLLADARLLVEAVNGGLGSDPDQVAVAFFILRQNEQVVVLVAAWVAAVVVLFADVEFTAEDRLDALLFGGVEEMDSAKDVAVVGHGARGPLDFWPMDLKRVLSRRLSDWAQFVHVAGAVE